MFETYGIYALAGGVVLAVVGYLWLLVRDWRIDWRWFLTVFLFPIAIPVFVVAKFRRAVAPALLLLVGTVLVAGTVGVNLYLAHQIDLGKREKLVDAFTT